MKNKNGCLEHLKVVGIAFVTIVLFIVFALTNGGKDDEPNEKTLQAIDNEAILLNYEEISKINADYLFDNAKEYKGKNIMSVAIVGDISGKTIKLKTDENKDDLFFNFAVECNNESDIKKITIDERVCFVGKVGDKFSVGGCVGILNAEIVASGQNVNKYELQLKKEKKKRKKTKDKNLNKKIGRKKYIDSCKPYSYNNIKRNPNKYKEKKIKIQGKVIQIDEGWFDSVVMRIEDSNGNDWFVSYSYSEGEDKILENDKIKVYGECGGTEQYTTIVGDTRRIPSIDAKYIK